MRFPESVRIALVAPLCVVTLGLAPAATAAGSEDCFVTGDSQGFDPSDCSSTDPTSDGFDTSSSGIPGAFVALFVLVLLLGVGGTIWRVSTARRLATEAGLDPDTATGVTLLDENGLSATYLASSLRHQQQSSPAPTPAPPGASAADRLAELKSLLDRGLITQAEHDQRRTAIIDSV